MRQFKNLALLDFSLKPEQEHFKTALHNLDKLIVGQKLIAAPIIDGNLILTKQIVKREDPSDIRIAIASIHYAGIQEANTALAAVKRAQSDWAARSFIERAEIIARAADIMTQERYHLAAVMIREVGKTWKEADADVVEAIDFCNYYAEQAERLGEKVKTDNILGEDNFYFYKPKGIALVIPPWNFPFAIACGMLTAALVCGNSAILKPAEQSSFIAAELVRILYQAGVPASALAFLPGQGEVIGRHLVDQPEINLIAFTGSRNVGLEIVQRASVLQPKQQHIKKVIAELGGKNAIIVDQDADLDQALKGILHSAYGYAGQKCSACSRVIVVGDNYTTFLARLKQGIESLIVSSAQDSAAFLGPVIDAEAYARIKQTILNAQNAGAKLIAQSQIPTPELGYYIPATALEVSNLENKIWTDEIFGPVIAISSAKTFQEAVSLALDSDYALTGGVFSRSPDNIKYAYENFLVGNLYINRSCTGAIVKRQPFGGFKLSGVGSKAGGPDYLLQFVDPRCVTENTMRRGFTPELL